MWKDGGISQQALDQARTTAASLQARIALAEEQVRAAEARIRVAQEDLDNTIIRAPLAGSVVLSFVFEALCIAFVGGLLGCVAVLPLNGLTTGTMNWQTFSHLAFAFRVTPLLLVLGVVFALLMGLVGGVPPAIRAARQRIAGALREL